MAADLRAQQEVGEDLDLGRNDVHEMQALRLYHLLWKDVGSGSRQLRAEVWKLQRSYVENWSIVQV
jgi:hypothetical protein